MKDKFQKIEEYLKLVGAHYFTPNKTLHYDHNTGKFLYNWKGQESPEFETLEELVNFDSSIDLSEFSFNTEIDQGTFQYIQLVGGSASCISRKFNTRYHRGLYAYLEYIKSNERDSFIYLDHTDKGMEVNDPYFPDWEEEKINPKIEKDRNFQNFIRSVRVSNDPLKDNDYWFNYEGYRAQGMLIYEYMGAGGCIAIVNDEKGKYGLLLERSDWITDDLRSLEYRLFDWAMGERFHDNEQVKVKIDQVERSALDEAIKFINDNAQSTRQKQVLEVLESIQRKIKKSN